MGNDCRIDLDRPDVFLGSNHQIIKELAFECTDFFLCIQNLGFQFFEIIGDIAFTIGEGLLAHPIVRNQPLVFILVGYLQKVSENIIIANLQAGDSGFFGFFLLQIDQNLFGVLNNISVLIEFFIIARLDYIAFRQNRWSFILYRCFDGFMQMFTRI